MNSAESPLIPPTMLYRFAVDCHRFEGKWEDRGGFELEAKCRLPVFSQLDGKSPLADLRAAWSAAGMWFTLEVSGKQQSPWCRSTQLLDSDGLSLWIDTRDTHNIHRASRFCHWLLALPVGGGTQKDEPLTSMLKINRAREFPRTFATFRMQCVSKVRRDGYYLAVHVPGSTLEGWNPDEHRRVGFHYLVNDRELGRQAFSVGDEFPASEDPTLWQTLRLID